MRGGPAIPNEALSVGTFNARRLWYGNGSVHDGSRVLTHILSVWSISVLCIQEVQAGEFPSLPADQLFHYDGPEGTFGREAAFLVRDGVRSVPVSGADDTTSVRWRVFGGSWCICSFYAPHAGVPIDVRISFWRDFVHSATCIHRSVDLPMIIAGDANVWHPHFRLRTRHCDSLVLLFVDLLISSCNLEICNPREQAHVGGGGLDCVFISGDHCCDEAPVCCPLLGSDHILCVAQPIPLPLGPSRMSEWRPLPPFRDWAPTLLRAQLHWSSRLDALLCGPLPVSDRSLIVEEIFNNLITILLQHAPSQRQLPRRRQPVWWTSECFTACVARWCVAGLQAQPGSSRPQSILRCTDPFPSDCQELPIFFLVSLARSCCQSFPGEPTCCSQRSQTHFPPGSVPTRPDTLCPLAGGTGSS